MNAITDWSSSSIYDLKELLQTYLLLGFADEFLLNDMPKTVSESTRRACTTVAHLLDDELVDKETLEHILDDLDGETSYRSLFPGDIQDYKRAVHQEVGEQSEYIKAARKRTEMFKRHRKRQEKLDQRGKSAGAKEYLGCDSDGPVENGYEIMGPRVRKVNAREVSLSTLTTEPGVDSEEDEDEDVFRSDEEEEEEGSRGGREDVPDILNGHPQDTQPLVDNLEPDAPYVTRRRK